MFRLFSFLYPKDEVPVSEYVHNQHNKTTHPQQVTVQVDETHTKIQTYPSPSWSESPPPATPTESSEAPVQTGDMSYRLEKLAFVRSGDKGDSCNIGLSKSNQSIGPVSECACVC